MGDLFTYVHSRCVVCSQHPMVPREGLKGTVSHMLSKPLDMMRDQLEGRLPGMKEHQEEVQEEATTMLKGDKQASESAVEKN